MDADELPPDVARFILEKIDTVPELEALLLLKHTSPQGWRAGALASRLYVPPREAIAVLAKLARLGLAAAGGEDFRFNLASPDAPLLERLAVSYRTQLTAIARLIHAKPSSALREFARAFDVKSDKP
jgi:hypothetical protein